MKKIMSVILVITICFSAMPVMAADCSVSKGGLTLSVPNGFTAYTEEEYAMSSTIKNAGIWGDIVDQLGWGYAAAFGGGFLIGLITDLYTESIFPGSLELVICDNSGSSNFAVCSCCNNAGSYNSNLTLSDYCYYDFREIMIPMWQEWLESLGYSSNVFDALLCETQNGIPYLQLDGYSNSNGCCRMAVIMYNGYYDVIYYFNSNESFLSDSSVASFNELINSISISVSPNIREPASADQIYDYILRSRVELNN